MNGKEKNKYYKNHMCGYIQINQSKYFMFLQAHTSSNLLRMLPVGNKVRSIFRVHL